MADKFKKVLGYSLTISFVGFIVTFFITKIVSMIQGVS